MFINQVEPFITDADRTAVTEYMSSGGWLTEHRHTREFEEQLAAFVGAKYASVVPNGTVGLYLALRSLGIGPGQWVGVPAYTMAATINAVLWAGAEPIIADVNPANGCMDIDRLVGVPVNAILYVQINGRSDSMDKLLQRRKDRGTLLIEDSCQALGSMHQGKCMGTFGDVGVYSFSPHKIITTGQGGAIVTNNEEVYNNIKRLRDFGRDKAGVDWHVDLGFNFKYTDLQAVIGKSQLSAISSRIEKKKAIFNKFYSEIPRHFSIPPLQEGNVPWFVDLLCVDQQTRDALALFLKGSGIGTRPFYPPLLDQPYLIKAGFDDSCCAPEAKRFAYRGLWLPSSLSLTDQQIDYILDKLHKF
jgi:perosamine synthetase